MRQDDFRYLPQSVRERIPGTPDYQKKRESDREKQEYSLLNQQLQRTIHGLEKEVKDHEDFKGIVQKANRHLIQSSILNLRYRDNLEKGEVVILSLQFILDAVMLSENPPNMKKILSDIQRPLAQLERVMGKRLPDLHQKEQVAKKKIQELQKKEE